MRPVSTHLAILFLLQCIILATANAGGPLNLAGPNGTTPVVYPNGGQDITLNYDQGGLGSRTNAQIDALVNGATGLWNDVSTATIQLTQGADLSQDVTVNNFGNYLNNFSDGLNPVIYDTDGSITDALVGVGAKNSILGFAEIMQRQAVNMETNKRLGMIRQNEVFCPTLCNVLRGALLDLHLDFADRGTYVCAEGPRMETPAEVRKYATYGAEPPLATSGASPSSPQAWQRASRQPPPPPRPRPPPPL
ncbi:MAG: hypothetical protein ABFS45_27220, partial [Pseudomonadota bacterium]